MAEAQRQWSEEVKNLGEQIVNLTLLKAKELGDYLKEEHGLEAAAGGVVMAAAPMAGEAAETAEEPTEFHVVLEDAGPNKIQVIKELRAKVSLGLKEAKDKVDSAPVIVLENASKEDADKFKQALEAVGAKVTLKAA